MPFWRHFTPNKEAVQLAATQRFLPATGSDQFRLSIPGVMSPLNHSLNIAFSANGTYISSARIRSLIFDRDSLDSESNLLEPLDDETSTFILQNDYLPETLSSTETQETLPYVSFVRPTEFSFFFTPR